MSASADIQTNTHSNVLTVPINAVTTRDKSDTGSVTKGGKAEKPKDEKTDQPQNGVTTEVAKNADDLDEVVFVLQKDGTVKRVKVRTDIQDINFIEVVDGLKEGDEVITGPYTTVSKLLRNGMKVKVGPKEELFEVKK
jgi:HlyD family secretion protein